MRPTGGGYPGTGSLTLVRNAAPVSVNLETEGTLDWFCLAGTSSTPRDQTTRHRKSIGNERFAYSFDWIQMAGGGLNNGATPLGVSVTNDSDDTGTGLTGGISNCGYVYGNPGVGFLFEVPADSFAERRLRLYAGLIYCTIQVTGDLSDVSAVQVSDSVTNGTAALVMYQYEYKFKPGRDGQRLLVRARATAAVGGVPSVWFSAATLA